MGLIGLLAVFLVLFLVQAFVKGGKSYDLLAMLSGFLAVSNLYRYHVIRNMLSTAERLLLAALYGGVDRPVYLERLSRKTAKPLRRGPRGFSFCLGGHHLPGSGRRDWRRRVAVSSKQKEAG